MKLNQNLPRHRIQHSSIFDSTVEVMYDSIVRNLLSHVKMTGKDTGYPSV